MHGDAANVEATNTTDDNHTDKRGAHAGQGGVTQGSLVPGQDLDACFGKVIRVVKAGDSFGELALLHKHARRTATVIPCPPHTVDSGQPSDRQVTKGVDLIRIGRQEYDFTVSLFSLQACWLHCHCLCLSTSMHIKFILRCHVTSSSLVPGCH